MVQFHAVLFANLLVLTLVPAARAVNPVQQVVQMLTEMETLEKKVMADYTKWVNDRVKDLGFEIKTAEGEVKKLTAAIDKADNTISRLGSEIGELDAEIAQLEADKKAATDQRDTENKEYQKAQQDYSESVDALESAIQVLKSQAYDRPQANAAHAYDLQMVHISNILEYLSRHRGEKAVLKGQEQAEAAAFKDDPEERCAAAPDAEQAGLMFQRKAAVVLKQLAPKGVEEKAAAWSAPARRQVANTSKLAATRGASAGSAPPASSPALSRWQGAMVILSLSAILLAVTHELLVVGVMKRCLLNDVCGRRMLQSLFLAAHFFERLDNTILIQLSYDMSISFGFGAAASGNIYGIYSAAGALAGILALLVTKKGGGRAIRTVLVGNVMTWTLATLLLGACTGVGLLRGQWGMYFVLALRLVSGLCATVGFYLLVFIAMRVTPASEMATFCVAIIVTTNLGFAAGPIMSSVVLGFMPASAPVYAKTASVVLLMAPMLAALSGAIACAVPLDVQPHFCAAKGADTAAREVDRNSIMDPEDLNASGRTWLIVWCLFYLLERTVTASSIEVGTALLFELLFGWSLRSIGYVICIAFISSGITGMLAEVILTKSGLHPAVVAMCMAAVSVVGACLFFDFGLSNGAVQIVVADSVVYSGAFVAGGVLDSLANRATMEGSWLSLEIYQVLKYTFIDLSRAAAAPVARAVIANSGRTTYATMLLILAALGVCTSTKVYCCLKPAGSVPRGAGQGWEGS